jgi:site-specific recombinase XerD
MEASLTIAPQRLVRRPPADPLAAVLAGQLSEHTRRAYRHDLGHLLAFLDAGPGLTWRALSPSEKHVPIERACAGPGAVGRLLGVSRADLIAFRTHLTVAGLSTLAVNRRLAGVGTILRELHLQGHRPDNPAERLRTLRSNGDYSPTIGLSAEQAKALLAAPVGDDLPALRDRALLALMLRNGLRAAEAAAQVYPHALRHAFTTLALEAGASLRRTQYALGHSDPPITERYDRARENLTDNAADYVARVLDQCAEPVRKQTMPPDEPIILPLAPRLSDPPIADDELGILLVTEPVDWRHFLVVLPLLRGWVKRRMPLFGRPHCQPPQRKGVKLAVVPVPDQHRSLGQRDSRRQGYRFVLDHFAYDPEPARGGDGSTTVSCGPD